jgi:hypothetical protein
MWCHMETADRHPVEISIRETSRNVWRVTFNGAVLGDSRGYAYADARREALRLVEQDHADSLARGEHATRVWRPA